MIEQFLKLKYGDKFYDYDYQFLLTQNAAEIAQLNNGVPLHKVLGFIELSGLKIYLNHKVLIPRYETEEMVNLALKYLKPNNKILDLCCGSGYIGLALKKAGNFDVTLSDISLESIKQSNENAMKNNLQVKIIKSDLFENINQQYDFIISNPPYIPSQEILPQSVLLYEPINALLADIDGLFYIKKILKIYKKFLVKDGYLIFEIHPTQNQFFQRKGFQVFQDINKKYRFALIKNH